MKRPFQIIHADDDDNDKCTTSPLNQATIVIEVDDCACLEVSSPSHEDEFSSKRARTSCDCSSLNLLVKAMERISRIPSETGPVRVVDRVPSMCHEVPAVADSRSSYSASWARLDESIGDHRHPPLVPIKSKVGHKRLCVSFNSSRLPPVLPLGRPLMAPPRLPTNMRPGQIMLRNNVQKDLKG
jgi:hypothetical protein